MATQTKLRHLPAASKGGPAPGLARLAGAAGEKRCQVEAWRLSPKNFLGFPH